MAKKNTPEMDPLVASLMPESDKKMGAIAGISLVVALAICLWASMYEQVVDEVVFDDSAAADLTASMTIDEKKEEKKEEKKKEEPKKPRKKAGGGGKPRGKGQPNAPQTRGVLKLLTAQTKNASAGAYDLMKNQKFSKDIDKVLKDVAGLQTTGKTVLGGRRGKADGGFNEGYAEGGSGGIGDGLAGLLGGGGGGIATKAKGSIRTPSERDIDMGAGGGSRSAADIMKVVRQRTPGLRHIYNKFLKKKPGFQGKVTLKFTIAPGGEIISISIASSTTGYGEFDGEVKTAVSRWKFSKVKSGNTTVTIPFTFSE
ncbi:MAG: TonB family protein [Fibrobacter sp.]|jgi:TonB family protein|uniref:AgmX/PglI C-terminal domain-containing protein n=1 Tax=unclassified Fibrobacter TaxID=2634177 RepID=UPI000920E288|nr:MULTISPECIES: AgmX/PglI C-terminal domain-containing protein [unclassified Fibrobacter]MBR4679519.1 TonB family protein [Fibrobacter sp.]OWV12272.1 energy transducer TonB [Fibrobacter sp. UWB5]PWJ66455.1 TonB family protein [Fibrobacter sp. UWB6]SHG03236.1 TonB family C-terminal domain-containing protein [Fibrobacter sp. UWB8]SHL59179.1 TonB family C-terminal domain-containing protein [Fibrobacter sp. UWT2]